jgi:hypothetical protein
MYGFKMKLALDSKTKRLKFGRKQGADLEPLNSNNLNMAIYLVQFVQVQGKQKRLLVR